MIVMTDNITTAKASPKKSQNVETTEPSENDTSVEAWSLALEGIVTEVAPEHIPNPPVAMLDWLYLAPMYCVRHKADELAADGNYACLVDKSNATNYFGRNSLGITITGH